MGEVGTRGEGEEAGELELSSCSRLLTRSKNWRSGWTVSSDLFSISSASQRLSSGSSGCRNPDSQSPKTSRGMRGDWRVSTKKLLFSQSLSSLPAPALPSPAGPLRDASKERSSSEERRKQPWARRTQVEGPER